MISMSTSTDICTCCYNNIFTVKHRYDKPDKYEEYCNIFPVKREWVECTACGHFMSLRNYDEGKLRLVYTDGYRATEFRETTIGQQFERVMAIEDSENKKRVAWLTSRLDPGALLDIGSGLGVFPYEMRKAGWDVSTTEINKDSIKFLSFLGFPCYDYLPPQILEGCFDVLSYVHVLEHFQSPKLALSSHRRFLGRKGYVFIEVPDAEEFKSLSKDHDEFNSCHLHFFTLPSLARIVETSGFKIVVAERVYYKQRCLSRIYMVAKCDL